ncbi:MAG: tRNA (5-methylaminomethyl-2-thiouridine)(34)-methyltransferase MnmD [Oligoflexia bacterium]|nr:tRNA (5-methylaminomethyl-2-thiouridine)(34)-methyltransferase MnmD [Oligoflexia bacterium]
MNSSIVLPPSAIIPWAELKIGENQVPFSTIYEDIYYSQDGGIDESMHVFLHGNNLPERWKQNADFVIGESGLGSALNLLVTWSSWKKFLNTCTCPVNHNLHYISFEKHPITLHTLQQIYDKGKRYEDSIKILDIYPQLLPDEYPSYKKLIVPKERLTISIFWGEMLQSLQWILSTGNNSVAPSIVPTIDAWFLDGHAPARNPDLWSSELFSLIKKITSHNGTLATYSVAGKVKNNLKEAGFDISKKTGYGRKREMLVGICPKCGT